MKSFNYFSPKNMLITLAALLVVAMGYMALKTYKPLPEKNITYDEQVRQMESQSDSDSIDSIEKDLNDTNIEASDKELVNIEAELNAETSY